MHGGYYPVGGSGEIAKQLLQTVADAGGWTRIRADVDEIMLDKNKAIGVRLKTGEEIIHMLESLKDDLHVTVISATHDYKMLAASDRVIYLSDGQIQSIKKRDELDIDVGGIME